MLVPFASQMAVLVIRSMVTSGNHSSNLEEVGLHFVTTSFETTILAKRADIAVAKDTAADKAAKQLESDLVAKLLGSATPTS